MRDCFRREAESVRRFFRRSTFEFSRLQITDVPGVERAQARERIVVSHQFRRAFQGTRKDNTVDCDRLPLNDSAHFTATLANSASTRMRLKNCDQTEKR